MKSLFIILSACFTLACSNPFDASISVRYEVTGSAGSVDISFDNGEGGISQMANVSLPWSYTLSADPGDYVYLYAKNREETGTVTVTIYSDGEVFKRATSQGGFVVVSVSGNLE